MGNIRTAINWSITKCNEPNIGYSQPYRNQQKVGGVTYYDCSSFIWYSLKAAGFPVETAYQTATGTAYSGNAITTHNMNEWLLAMGFTRYNPASEPWQQGDVMLVHNDSHQHTEMVYNGAEYRCMGAHSSSYPLADQVSISQYSSQGTWMYGYRYPSTPASWHAKPTGEYAQDSVEAYENAVKTYELLSSRGWSLSAVCGLLGNIAKESVYNPWRWEGDIIRSEFGTSGYGLVQFTPGTKYIQDNRSKAQPSYAPNYSGATDPKPEDAEAQLIFIDLYADYYSTASYPESYAEYKVNNKGAEYSVRAWIANYERPLDPSTTLAERIAAGNYWYEVLSGIPPQPYRRLPIWIYFKIKRC